MLRELAPNLIAPGVEDDRGGYYRRRTDVMCAALGLTVSMDISPIGALTMDIEIQLPDGTWVPLSPLIRPTPPEAPVPQRRTPALSPLYGAAGKPVPLQMESVSGQWVDVIC
ncbi:hypothetical protein WT83_29075 [Burkholderia territorii]|uniref:Uncharacterized protein n=1 Tax=Burkholderia territorii TaxID=1503055 RepID=A0A108E6J3_9BURK|nr:hypothetical protein [Burkholderia territorii]KWN05615.1 hypothetical protein WT83_29075 [Burkholderia territorii]